MQMSQMVEQTKFREVNFIWNLEKLFDKIIHLNIVRNMKIKQISLNKIIQEFLINLDNLAKFYEIFYPLEVYLNQRA